MKNGISARAHALNKGYRGWMDRILHRIVRQAPAASRVAEDRITSADTWGVLTEHRLNQVQDLGHVSGSGSAATSHLSLGATTFLYIACALFRPRPPP